MLLQGTEVAVTVSSGAVYRGLLFACDVDSADGMAVVLKYATIEVCHYKMPQDWYLLVCVPPSLPLLPLQHPGNADETPLPPSNVLLIPETDFVSVRWCGAFLY